MHRLMPYAFAGADAGAAGSRTLAAKLHLVHSRPSSLVKGALVLKHQAKEADGWWSIIPLQRVN